MQASNLSLTVHPALCRGGTRKTKWHLRLRTAMEKGAPPAPSWKTQKEPSLAEESHNQEMPGVGHTLEVTWVHQVQAAGGSPLLLVSSPS
jgi:hypothetical protein